MRLATGFQSLKNLRLWINVTVNLIHVYIKDCCGGPVLPELAHDRNVLGSNPANSINFFR